MEGIFYSGQEYGYRRGRAYMAEHEEGTYTLLDVRQIGRAHV